MTDKVTCLVIYESSKDNLDLGQCICSKSAEIPDPISCALQTTLEDVWIFSVYHTTKLYGNFHTV